MHPIAMVLYFCHMQGHCYKSIKKHLFCAYIKSGVVERYCIRQSSAEKYLHFFEPSRYPVSLECPAAERKLPRGQSMQLVKT